MTMPIVPSSVPDMAAAVAGAAPDSAAIRMGTVAEVSPTRLLVRIGNATVATETGWLFSYQPILGDVVAVTRQGAAWITLGSLGSIVANNAVINAGFENGSTGVSPPNWSLVTTAGTPSLTTTLWDANTRADGIEGSQVAAVVASAGVVTTELVSDPVPVAPGDPWAIAGYYRTLADFTATSVCSIVLNLSWYSSSSLGSLLSTKGSGTHVVARGPEWRLLRVQGSRGITAPAGAQFLRLRFSLSWSSAASGDAVYFDRTIARRLA